MNKDEKHISFRANKSNPTLIKSLRSLAQKANRRLNDYLNVILAKHVEDNKD